MSNGRKLSRRDLPALYLIGGFIFGFAALALPFGAKLDMAKRNELHAVSGIVQSITRTTGKVTKLNIVVWDGNRSHHLTQDDLYYDVPTLHSLRTGDPISALVRRDFLGRDLEWFWEIRRGTETILSYDQTQRFLESEKERTDVFAYWAGVLSIAFLMAAIFLRVRFGAWQASTR
jgi:hypothetical protein